MIQKINIKKNLSYYKTLLIILFILLLPFQQIILFDNSFLNQLNLSEIIFILLVISSSRSYYINLIQGFKISDLIILFWFLTSVLSYSFGSIFFLSHVDLLGTAFLTYLYFLFKTELKIKYINLIIEIIIIACLLCSLLGLFGVFLSIFFDLKSNLIYFEESYPYLGEIGRIQSFMKSPSMFANFIILGAIFTFTKLFLKKTNFINILIFIIIFTAFVLSFTKSIICLFCGIIIASICCINLTWRLKIFFILISFVVSFVLYNLLSHFIIVITSGEFSIISGNIYEHGIFVVKKTIYSFDFFSYKINFYPTSYYFNKIASLKAFSSSPLYGIGIGNYNMFISELQNAGDHPKNFPNWDPHSAFFGTLAEKGIFGFVSLLLLLLFSFYQVFKINNEELYFIKFSLIGILCALIIDASCVDIMKFRHLWIIFVIISVVSRNNILKTVR